MKRQFKLEHNAANALLSVLFRQSSNAREGWYSKEVVAKMIQFNHQDSYNCLNPISHINSQQHQQSQ